MAVSKPTTQSSYCINTPLSFWNRLKEHIKHYKLITRPYYSLIRPIRNSAYKFSMKHEPFRSILLRIKNFKTCKLSTVYDYCKEHDGIIKVYDDSCEYPARPLCKTREEFETNIFAEPVMRPAYYIYVSKIRDAVIFSQEDIILAGGCFLIDRKQQTSAYHFYIGKNVKKVTKENALARIPRNPVVIERGIDLVKMWSGNIYHFSCEALSRLQLVDAIEEYRTWPLIVDENALKNVWSAQLLDMVNTYHHPIIALRCGEDYLVKEMIYPSFLNWEGNEALWYAPRMHKMVADYLREKITCRHSPSRTYKNVYIPRGNNKRLLNENKVIECLKKYGFEIISQGADNYSQTLDAFMTADNIIGIMGASMLNTIVAKPDAMIYIITPYEYQHDNPGFAVTDASCRRLRFIAADISKLDLGAGTTKITGLNTSTFTVDINRIEAIAKKLSS